MLEFEPDGRLSLAFLRARADLRYKILASGDIVD